MTVTMMTLAETGFDPLRTDWLSLALASVNISGPSSIIKVILSTFYIAIVITVQPYRSRSMWKQDVVLGATMGVFVIEITTATCNFLSPIPGDQPEDLYAPNCAFENNTNRLCLEVSRYFFIVILLGLLVFVLTMYYRYLRKLNRFEEEKRRSQTPSTSTESVEMAEMQGPSP